VTGIPGNMWEFRGIITGTAGTNNSLRTMRLETVYFILIFKFFDKLKFKKHLYCLKVQQKLDSDWDMWILCTDIIDATLVNSTDSNI